MPQYFSYVDTTLRVIYINTNQRVNTENIEKIQSMLSQLERMPDLKADLVKRNISKQFDNASLSNLYYHEAHHYWQTFFYPFLYYMSWQEFRIIMNCRQFLRYNKQYDQLPFQPELLSAEEKNTMEYTSKPFRLIRNNGQLTPEINIEGASRTDSDVFCLIDLLEDSTTLFQYKCDHEIKDADAYYAWIANPQNIGYKRLYKYLCKQFGKEVVFNFLPVWVQLAFSTTEPIGNFCNFITLTFQHHLENTDPIVAYEELNRLFLNHYPIVDFNPAEYRILEQTPVSFLDTDLLKNIINASNVDPDAGHFPLAYHGNKWLQLFSENPDFKFYLLQPDKEKIAFLFEQLYPYLTFFNFMDYDSRKNALFIPEDYNKRNFKYNSNFLSYKEYLPEILKKKEIITGIITSHNTYTPHNCHHLECSYFSTDLCRRWNAIPAKFKDCAFPSWFATEFYYEIDIENQLIKRIGTTAIEAYKKRYDDLQKVVQNKRGIQYLKDDGDNFILTISKTIIETGQTNYFDNFIKLAKEDFSLQEFDFFNKVIFDFPEYISDDRFIFEIPEITQWFRQLKTDKPHFFLYPSWNSEYLQGFTLFPMFISYKKFTADNGNSNIQLDMEPMINFMIEETVIMGKWCQGHGIEGDPYILPFLDYLKNNV